MQIQKTLISDLKNRLNNNTLPIKIPLLRGDNFFEVTEINDFGISVSNLGSQPLLPWTAFEEAIGLLNEKNGAALKGDAMNGKLGDSLLPTDSIEGRIAFRLYKKQLGNSVFRRITPISGILIWTGLCVNEGKQLLLMQP